MAFWAAVEGNRTEEQWCAERRWRGWRWTRMRWWEERRWIAQTSWRPLIPDCQGLISAGCSRAWLEGEGRESGGDGNATPSWRSASAQREGSAEAVAQRAREIDSISG